MVDCLKMVESDFIMEFVWVSILSLGSVLGDHHHGVTGEAGPMNVNSVRFALSTSLAERQLFSKEVPCFSSPQSLLDCARICNTHQNCLAFYWLSSPTECQLTGSEPNFDSIDVPSFDHWSFYRLFCVNVTEMFWNAQISFAAISKSGQTMNSLSSSNSPHAFLKTTVSMTSNDDGTTTTQMQIGKRDNANSPSTYTINAMELASTTAARRNDIVPTSVLEGTSGIRITTKSTSETVSLTGAESFIMSTPPTAHSTAQTMSTAIVTTASTPTSSWCQYEYIPSLQKCVQFHSSCVSWSKARTMCQSDGGELLDFSSETNFNTFLDDVMSSRTDLPRTCNQEWHLGLRWTSLNKVWTWTNSGGMVSSGSSVWADGYPNVDDGADAPDADNGTDDADTTDDGDDGTDDTDDAGDGADDGDDGTDDGDDGTDDTDDGDDGANDTDDADDGADGSDGSDGDDGSDGADGDDGADDADGGSVAAPAATAAAPTTTSYSCASMSSSSSYLLTNNLCSAGKNYICQFVPPS